MKTFAAIAALGSIASALKLRLTVQGGPGFYIQGQGFGENMENLLTQYDQNQDGTIDGADLVRLAEYIEQDGTLDSAEMGSTIMMHADFLANVDTTEEVVDWLIDILASAADDSPMMSYDDFMEFASILGVSQDEANDAFVAVDEDGNWELSTSEQADAWGEIFGAGSDGGCDDETCQMLNEIMEISMGIINSVDDLRDAFTDTGDDGDDGNEDSSWYDSNQDGVWNDEDWYATAWNSWGAHDGNDYYITRANFREDEWPGKDDEDWEVC